MQNKTETADRTQSKPRRFKGMKMVLCMGLAMGGAVLLTPTQQAEAGGCYSRYGYGGYGSSFGYYNTFPSYRSGFTYSSPSFGIGIYSGGPVYRGGSFYRSYRGGYRGGYGYRGYNRGHHHGHHGHRGYSHGRRR